MSNNDDQSKLKTGDTSDTELGEASDTEPGEASDTDPGQTSDMETGETSDTQRYRRIKSLEFAIEKNRWQGGTAGGADMSEEATGGLEEGEVEDSGDGAANNMSFATVRIRPKQMAFSGLGTRGVSISLELVDTQNYEYKSFGKYVIAWGDKMSSAMDIRSGVVTYTHKYNEVPNNRDITITIYTPPGGPYDVKWCKIDSDAYDLIAMLKFGSLILSPNSFEGCSNLEFLDETNAPRLSHSTRGMFKGAKKFNGDLRRWNVGEVTNMSNMFEGAEIFEGRGLAEWGVSKVKDMAYMFHNAYEFDGDLGSWGVGAVQNMASMFEDAHSFRGRRIGKWSVGSVVNMTKMFCQARRFTTDLSKWQPLSVESMDYMFYKAYSYTGKELAAPEFDEFNERDEKDEKNKKNKKNKKKREEVKLKWQTPRVQNMAHMFHGAHSFIGEIGTWETSAVTDMEHMFSGATSFNVDLSTWDVAKVKKMGGMFENALKFNSPLFSNTNKCRDMSAMFKHALSFKQEAINFETNLVENMKSMFEGAVEFAPIQMHWDTSSVTDMSAMFKNCCKFGGAAVAEWNTKSVTNMSETFFGATKFDSHLNWDTSKVTNMRAMFCGAISLRHLMVKPKMKKHSKNRKQATNKQTEKYQLLFSTSEVTNMSSMFEDAESLETITVPGWNTSRVEDMSSMFKNAKKFNEQSVSQWKVSNVTDMRSAFYGASEFNASLKDWAPSKLKFADAMFYKAQKFQYDINNWKIDEQASVENMHEDSTPYSIKPATVEKDRLLAVRHRPPANDYSRRFLAQLKAPTNSVNGTVRVYLHICSQGPGVSTMFIRDEFSHIFNTSTIREGTHVYDISEAKTEGVDFSKITLDISIPWAHEIRILSFHPSSSSSSSSSSSHLPQQSILDVANPPLIGGVSDERLPYYELLEIVQYGAVFLGERCFANCGELVKLPPTRLDGKFLPTNLSYMFKNAANLKDPPDWDTSRVTDMYGMFQGAKVLNSQALEFDTSLVTDMRHMFDGASSFDADITTWDTARVQYFNAMFYNTEKFSKDISGWSTASCREYVLDMFNRRSATSVYHVVQTHSPAMLPILPKRPSGKSNPSKGGGDHTVTTTNHDHIDEMLLRVADILKKEKEKVTSEDVSSLIQVVQGPAPGNFNTDAIQMNKEAKEGQRKYKNDIKKTALDIQEQEFKKGNNIGRGIAREMARARLLTEEGEGFSHKKDEAKKKKIKNQPQHSPAGILTDGEDTDEEKPFSLFAVFDAQSDEINQRLDQNSILHALVKRLQIKENWPTNDDTLNDTAVQDLWDTFPEDREDTTRTDLVDTDDEKTDTDEETTGGTDDEKTVGTDNQKTGDTNDGEAGGTYGTRLIDDAASGSDGGGSDGETWDYGATVDDVVFIDNNPNPADNNKLWSNPDAHVSFHRINARNAARAAARLQESAERQQESADGPQESADGRQKSADGRQKSAEKEVKLPSKKRKKSAEPETKSQATARKKPRGGSNGLETMAQAVSRRLDRTLVESEKERARELYRKAKQYERDSETAELTAALQREQYAQILNRSHTYVQCDEPDCKKWRKTIKKWTPEMRFVCPDCSVACDYCKKNPCTCSEQRKRLTRRRMV